MTIDLWSVARREGAAKALLADWFTAKLFVISETTGDTYHDWRELIADAKRRASSLGLSPVDVDDIIPTHVRELLAYDEEYGS